MSFTKLNQTQIDQKINYIEKYKRWKNAASVSNLDANANVSTKNIATLEAEINKDINIQINRKLVTDKIKELYDDELANEYIRQIEEHEIYKHDEWTFIKPYCVSLSLYPFLLNGTTQLWWESKAPQNIWAFAWSFVNLIFAVSSQFAWAVATVEFLMYFDYFAKKEWWEWYMKNLKPIEKEITQLFQHVVYSLNQPASARWFQSVFFNISIFDEYFFSSLFESFSFPDGSKPEWESLNSLQQFFMSWFNKEREKAILTFPVVTSAMLVDNNTPKDRQFAERNAKELSEWNSFFVYQSKSVDSLASCCFDANQKCLTKSSDWVNYMTFEELSNSKYKELKRNFSIFHNWSWVKWKEVKLPADRKMFKITTANKKEFIMSDNHISPCIDWEKQTKDLIVWDKLLFNTNKLDTFPEKDLWLTYEQWFSIWAFLWDWSFWTRTKYWIFEINYSLWENKVYKIKSIIDTLWKIWNIWWVQNNVYPLRYSNKELVEFIQEWTNWEEWTLAFNKKLNLNCLLQSKEFRQWILDWWYETDWWNSNRCYTTSSELAENMEVLITSLWMNSIIDISDRTDEPVIIRWETYKRNYPLYCVRWYDTKNKRSMWDIYTYKNNSIYFNITKIEEIDYNKEYIYCFEMDNKDEQYFTLPNWLITHNCRLRNELVDNTFSYSLWAWWVSTGSISVITINFNRLIQKKIDLKEQVEKIHKYHIAYRKVMEDFLSAKMLPVYDAWFITLDKQFLTVWINWMAEWAESQWITVGNNEKYKEFVSKHLKIIYDENKLAKINTGYMFNTEFVPAENLWVKNAKWDKDDWLIVNRDCYNSYFYLVEDEEITPVDKFILHWKDNCKYLDWWSALHLNLWEYLTKENYLGLFDISAKTGCNYFTTNVKITICNECWNIDKRTLTHCPKCASNNIDYWTRVIGYLKRVSAFSEWRQEEEGIREYHS